jgi:uncharacterized phage protein gp47/JayE
MVVSFEDKNSELMSSAIDELRASTDITQLTPGAKARSLLEIINREIANAYNSFSVDLLQAFVNKSEGRNLDFIGELMGVSRIQASRNALSSVSQVQRFFVENGTFGDINGSSSFTIPTGTIVSTRITSDEEEAISYTLTTDVICSAAASEVFASLRSLEFGDTSNIGAGSLVIHNYEQYTDYLNLTLKTTNVEGIAYAENTESDINYRYRIINQTLASEQANSTSIRLAVLSVPGVADVQLDEYNRGIGTGAAYIKAVVPTVGAVLISTAQDAIDRVRAFGNFIEARQPPLVGIELQVTLNLIKELPTLEATNLKARVRSAIYQYINGLDINQDLDLELLEREILGVDSNIKSLGIPSKRLDQVFIWKYSAAEDNRIRFVALNGYTAVNNQRIVVEFTPLSDNADPIIVLI